MPEPIGYILYCNKYMPERITLSKDKEELEKYLNLPCDGRHRIIPVYEE